MTPATFVTRMALYDRIVASGKFSAGTLAVAWVLLFKFYNSTTGRCDPGQTAIGKAAGVSPRHVKRATDELATARWFVVKSGEGSMTRFGPTTSYEPQFVQVTNLSGDDEFVTPDETVTGDKTRQQGVTNLSGKQGKEEQGNILVRLPDPIAEQFELFWRAMPKRGGHSNPKKAAKKKFDRLVRSGVSPAELIAGAKAYRVQIEAAGTNPQFVKGAANWLENEMWRDSLEPIEAPLLRAGMC